MSRTNIDLDDELVERVMRRYRLPTKKAAVDFALKAVAGDLMSRREALEMEGSGWDADLADLRDEEVERP